MVKREKKSIIVAVETQNFLKKKELSSIEYVKMLLLDALSIRDLNNGRIELGVHIADVSYFVKENSLTDLEARSR